MAARRRDDTDPTGNDGGPAAGTTRRDLPTGGGGVMQAYDRDEMRVIPERSWLVPDRIPRGTVGLFFGAASSFKSTASQDLVAGLTTAGDWLGIAPARTPVFYVCGEAYQ